MHFSLFPSNLSNIFGLSGGQLVGIIVPVAVFFVGGTIAITAMYFHHRRKALWHETARIALERGQPLPPADVDQTAKIDRAADGPRSAAEDLRAGLICIGVGVGLCFFFESLGAYPMRYVGAIPGFIGVALLLYGLLALAFGRKSSATSAPSDSRPPHS